MNVPPAATSWGLYRAARSCGTAVQQAKRFGLSVERVNATLRVRIDYCPLCDDDPRDSAAYGPIWCQVDHHHNCCTGCPRCVRRLFCKPCTPGSRLVDTPRRGRAAAARLLQAGLRPPLRTGGY
ncbi:endonuclease domain-containing protein [Streptomyces alboniger]